MVIRLAVVTLVVKLPRYLNLFAKTYQSNDKMPIRFVITAGGAIAAASMSKF